MRPLLIEGGELVVMFSRNRSGIRLPIARVMGTLVATSAILSPSVAYAEEVSKFSEMVKKGSAQLDLRYRFEYVDQDGIDEEAEASTLRSRLTLNSATYKGFSFLGEFDNVAKIGDDNYNSTENGKTQYPVVADPTGTDLNQVWLKYAFETGAGTAGRQRINQGNQRFVGGVGWRQNEQTFDGGRIEWQALEALSLDYAYVYKVKRIFGPDDGAQPADFEGDNHFARVDWKISDDHGIAGYYYAVDVEERDNYSAGATVNQSNSTYGLEYTGKIGPLGATAAYATQSDAGDSELDYDADYYMVQLGAEVMGVNGVLGYEVLAAGDGVGFKTPYATLHKFQGWADKFLGTPDDGIEDAWVGLTGKLGPVKLGAYYHDFQAEDSNADFGTEIDLVATWPINEHLSLQAKFADFDSDDDTRYQDTTKGWLTVQFKL